MKLIALFILFFTLLPGTAAWAGLGDPWVDSRTGVQWLYLGKQTYDEGFVGCQNRGAHIPSINEIVVALNDGIADLPYNSVWAYTSGSSTFNIISPPNYPWIGVWVNAQSVKLNHKVMVYTSVEQRGQDSETLFYNPIHTVCAGGNAPLPIPIPPPAPVPAADACARYTMHGISACLGNPNCDWSSSSRQCFTKLNMPCTYYTQHGIGPCLNSGGQCDWSSDSRQCFIKLGMPCEYYTVHGIGACLNSGGQCDWSSTSRQCYRK